MMFVSWYRTDTDIETNPIFDAFGNSLGIPLEFRESSATGSYLRVLSGIAKHCTNGNIAGLSDEKMEVWAAWRGAPGHFAKTFRAYFVKQDVVKGWTDRQKHLIDREERLKKDSERKRRGIPVEKKRNSSGIPDDFQRHNTIQDNTKSSSLSQSDEKSVAPAPDPKPLTWIQQVGAAYEKRFGEKSFKYPKQAKLLQPLFELPIDDILSRLETYWSRTKPEHINHAKFAETWQTYEPTPPWDTPVYDDHGRPTAYGRSLGIP